MALGRAGTMRALRPAALIRRKALMTGIFGSSRFWKVVAVFVFGSSALRRIFGKQPEVIEVTQFKGSGHLMQVETMPWQARRASKRIRH